jgi:sugar phosphate isomerase/epimerase
MKFPLALQAYTIRDELARDFFGALERVAETGYRGVELPLPLPGVTTGQAKDHLGRIGLQWVACHAGDELLAGGLEELIHSLAEAGCAHLVLPYLSFSSKEEVIGAAGRLDQIGAACRAQKIQFSYHHHDHEFKRFEGERILDILRGATDPELVKFELDTYWVKRGDEDPAAFLRGFQDRCPLLHIKDMEPGPEGFFAEIGEGILDFEGIFRAAEEVGVQWLVVEQDESRRPLFESIAISYRNLCRLGMCA